MNPEDVLKWVDTIHQEKNIERELIFEALETALSKAAGKKLVNIDAEPAVIINRETGDVTFYEVEVEEQEDEEYNEDTGEMEPVIKKIRHIKEDEVIPIDPGALGRVAAQTAKQVIIQRIREAERDAIYDEYADRKGDIVSCTVQRVEANNNIICTLDNRTEAFFPRWEQVRDEHYDVGERVKSLILDVKKSGGQKVKIILSRTHPNFVRKLFEQEVPEIADHTIDIKALVREPGYRSKVAVSSIDPTKIDPVGACVGVRGSRIKGIIDELNGEKIDIIRWNDSAEVLIQNALKPAAIASITLDYDHTKARVVVPDDQLSLAIGKGGQNVRLASRLSGWDIDIMSQAQERALGYRAIAKFQTIPTVDEELATRLFNAGYTTFDQLLEAGPDMLRDRADGVNEEHANGICEWLENVDEEEYYREVVVDLPPELAPVSPAEKMARLFGGGGGGGGEAEGEGADLGGGAAGNGGPRSATELFSKKDAPAGADAPAADGPVVEGLDVARIAEWTAMLPGGQKDMLATAKAATDGDKGLTPDAWRAVFDARGWKGDDYDLFMTQFEDGDADYLAGFVGASSALIAAASSGDDDSVREALGEMADYNGLTLSLVSTLPMLRNPATQPLIDWTSALLLMCKADAAGNKNPLLVAVPALDDLLGDAIPSRPMSPPSLAELGAWLRDSACLDSLLPGFRAVAEAAGKSVGDTSVALWALGLRGVDLNMKKGEWKFRKATDSARVTALGFDPDFALFMDEQAAEEGDADADAEGEGDADAEE